MRTIFVKGEKKLIVENKNELSSARDGPKEGAKISVVFQNVECSCDYKELLSCFLDNNAQHEYGFPTCAVDRSLEVAFSVMKDGETAEIKTNFPACIGVAADDVSLSCIATLSIIENGSDIYDYSSMDKFEFAQKAKAKACKLLQNHSDQNPNALQSVRISAFILLKRAMKWLSLIDPDCSFASQEKSKILKLKCQCYNNLSHIHLSFGHNELAVDAASFVIGEDDSNVKALYRRAVANTSLQNYELAQYDLDMALQLEPENNALQKQLKIVQQKQKMLDDKYAIAMKKFLNL